MSLKSLLRAVLVVFSDVFIGVSASFISFGFFKISKSKNIIKNA